MRFDRFLPLAAVTMLLGSVTSCAPRVQKIYIPTCPHITAYSVADQQQLKREIQAHTEASMIRRVASDYIGLRDQARACQTKAKQVQDHGTH